jgi:uncharacterized membrane protein YheB (UPF0754 family)
MDITQIILPPVVGAGIGWFTNYIAIKLLFRPHIPIEVFGYKIQGIIPKRRREIARSLARAIENELLSSSDLASTLKGIDWKAEIEKTVEEAVEHRFGERLKEVPVIGLISENIKYHVKYLLTKEVLRQVETKKGSLAKKLTDHIDVEDMVVTKIDRLDLMRFERLLTEFIARELKHLEWLGGVMGFLIGLAQSGYIYLIG